jgi:hypothetical protein
MRLTITQTIAGAALLSLGLAACTTEASAPAMTSFIASDVPLADEDVLAFLLEAPELPASLGEVVVARTELRHPELFERYIVQLVRVAAGSSVSLAAHLADGVVIRLPVGATLDVAVSASVAALDGDIIAEAPAMCEAPCTVVGPALVASSGWFVSWGVQTGWLLVAVDS